MTSSLYKSLLIIPLALLGASAANGMTCPAIGNSSDCSVIITRSATGAFSLTSTGVGPYDGSDDTLVGIVNNGPDSLASVTLTGNDIFGFDGDGINIYPGGGSYGPTGYEGPNTSFVVTDFDHGKVLFTGGLASGASAYFALENDLSGAAGTPPPIVISGTPEPEMWALMLVGFGSIGAVMRRRATTVVVA